MNNLFSPKKLVQLDSSYMVRTLRDRRDQILGAIGDRTLEPSEEVMKELDQINKELGDYPAEDELFQ